MGRVLVIGATGHVGSYLVPRLVRAGHEVVALSRGERAPYHEAPEWRAVRAGVHRPRRRGRRRHVRRRWPRCGADAVIDMICFTPESARQLVDALRPTRPLLLHCGTIWVHGPAARVPLTEDEPRTAYGEYGTGKAAIEALLHRETLAGGVPSVVLHPGPHQRPGLAGHHAGRQPRRRTCGGGWPRGEPLPLPDLGLGVLHHVHADDVAQAFERALTRPAAIGSSFHVVAEQAMTCRGLAAGVAALVRPRAGARARRLGRVRAPRRRASTPAATREHVEPQHRRQHRPGAAVLGYAPRYSARCRRCTRRCAGWSSTVAWTSAVTPSDVAPARIRRGAAGANDHRPFSSLDEPARLRAARSAFRTGGPRWSSVHHARRSTPSWCGVRRRLAAPTRRAVRSATSAPVPARSPVSW